MLKCLRHPALAALLVLSVPVSAAAAGDPAAGQKVFKKCKACHAVGSGAKNKVGPHLNDVMGRTAGALDGFKYSKAMLAAGSDGLVWDAASMDAFLEKPKQYIKKTKMAFAGLRKESDRVNLIAYLMQYSAGGTPEPSAAAAQTQVAVKTETPSPGTVSAVGSHGVFGLGRPALPEEIAAWDIDIRPDGAGLPEGKGTVAQGEVVYTDNCAMCHGDFGEGVDRWPVLAGGFDTLTEDRPEKTIGSYWPYLSTVYDYVRRAMPFGNAQSLSDDEVYAIVAYLLYLNDIVDDEGFELSKDNFLEHRLPNEKNFIPDGRAEEAHYVNRGEPCMQNCTDAPVEITMRARVLDVTPDGEDDQGGGAVD